MKYTLYIDESGDFESPNQSWLIGGLIIADSFKNSEDKLRTAIYPLIKKYELNGQDDFHLTEIRRNSGNDKALNIATDLFKTLNSANTPSCFVTTINKAKVSAHNLERTYRLMLLDLIIQAETAVHEFFNSEITHLDLVVATRTINAVRQTTQFNIDQEILQALPKAVESDLVASGQIALLNNIEVHMRDAKYQWGLICADFICNITYNQRFSENYKILNDLKDNGQLFSFETFSSPELRRILNHERNQNYINALFDSLKLVDRHPKNKDYKSALYRLIKVVFTQTGSSGAKIYFEGLLERIWRDKTVYKSYFQKLNILIELLHILEDANTELGIRNFNSFKFKLNNLALLCLNHIGDVDKAKEVVQRQKSIINELISDPSNFSMILDFHSREVEIYVNSLDFEKSEELARAHWNMIDEYRNIWELISPDMEKSDFLRSSMAIRAKSTLIRCMTLNYSADKTEVIKSYIEEILPYLSHKSDKSRIFCLRLLILSKECRLDDAVNIAIDYINENEDAQEFDYFFSLFVLNQKLLISEKSDIKELITRVDDIVNSISVNSFSMQYIDMLRCRELSLFYHFKGLKRESHDYLKKAQSLELVKLSPIAKYLSAMNQVQLDFINNNLKNISQYDCNHPELNIDSIGALQDGDSLNLLFNLRYYLAS
ncbi:DUF3800 domain-containing protein [Psychrobacter faecalis]|uniref:DUF3800 domain-containing protein n=1 Tax=Psychrobacter faecalis TaxID=180588 RepID=UPI003FD3D698